MTTFVRRRKLGMTSIKGIMAASNSDMHLSNNFDPQGIRHDDVYIRWGCTSSVPNKEARVINSAESIHRISDKSGFRKDMQEHGLCPETWWDIDDVPNPHDPMIVRSQTHSQGRGMWVCYGQFELTRACEQAGRGYYINRLINKQSEYRVFVHQGYVVWVAQKTPGNPNDVAWNVAKGGRFDNVRWGDWDMAVVNNALDVFTLTKAHFAGIDVMLDAGGKALCVEANSAPSQTSPYRQACVAKAFDHMIEKGDFHTDLRWEGPSLTWRDAIHPGIWS